MECKYVFRRGPRKGMICLKINCRQHKILNSLDISLKEEGEHHAVKNSYPSNEYRKNSRDLDEELLLNKPLWKYRIVNTNFLKFEGLKRLIPRVNEKIKTKRGEEISIPQIINNRWVLDKKIGKGGFGVVFSCIDRLNQQLDLAIKIEPYGSLASVTEVAVLESMKGSGAVPEIFSTGTVDDKISFIVMEKLLPLKFQIKAIPEILEVLEKFYSKGWSHGDVKFANMMRKKCGRLVMIDMGLSRRLGNDNRRSLGGTIMFMSEGAHLGFSVPKNDLESLIYCVLNVIFDLPWTNQKIDYKTKEGIETVLKMKRALKEAILQNRTHLSKISTRLQRLAFKIFSSENPDFNAMKKSIKTQCQ